MPTTTESTAQHSGGAKPGKRQPPELLDARYGLPIVHDPAYKEATLHVHGYAAVRRDEEHQRLLNHIAAGSPETLPVVVRWQSSDWKPALALPLLRVLPVLITTKSLATALNPSLLLLDAAIVSGGTALHYYRVSDRAIDVGRSLRDAIEGLPYDRINLVGHSLGTTAVCECLKLWSETPSHKSIGNVLLLSGATPCTGYEWLPLVEPVDGFVINIHNPKDKALLSIGVRRRIGRHGIPAEHPRILNLGVSNIGHVEYWKNLPAIRQRLRNELAVHL